MIKRWKARHTIEALSHFNNEDLPQPFSDSSFYINIIRNLFHNKNSCEVVNIELLYQFSNDNRYMAVIVTPRPKIDINYIVDVKNFISWFNTHYEELLYKYEYITPHIVKKTYTINKDYIRYSIVTEQSSNFSKILIEFKTLN